MPTESPVYGRRGIVKLRIPKLPWDLIVTLLYTAVASLTILSFREGALWAVLLVLFAPGYAIVAALFPPRGLSAPLRTLLDGGRLPRVDKGLPLVLAASIVFAGAVVVDIAITPRPVERFTQFFILDDEGGINGYPPTFAVSAH